MQIRIFRWKAIGPLLLVFLILGILVWLFAEPVVKDTTEEASTELLGTQVDIGKLDIVAKDAAVNLQVLQVADPFDVKKNLLQADQIRVKLNPEALAEKKFVVERFQMNGIRFGTTRTTPARPVEGDGFAPQALRTVRQWAQQFDVPILKLTPIDTIKQLVLNPTQLTSVQTAQALVARTDSTRKALEQEFRSLNVETTVDSARRLAERLSDTDPRKLGVDGTRKAIEEVQTNIKQIDATKAQLTSLEKQVRGGVGRFGFGLQELDDARKKDYAFARSLLQLPSFAAPEIGEAFFGQVSIDRFQKALYWTQLARHYMPPGLLPREDPGPKRLRAAGRDIRFPKQQDWPKLLVQLAQLDLTLGGDHALRGAYTATVQGLTSDPALYGKPTLVRTTRSAQGSAIENLAVNAVIDHVRADRVKDSVSARLKGVSLPAFGVPGLPFRLDPGRGAANLDFSLRNDQMRGRWAINSNQVAWALDTTGKRLNDLETIVWRVVSGLKNLSVNAEVSGAVKAPKLSVSSNLDRAIADRLEAVIGEEVAKAEKMARAKVDSVVTARVEPVKRQIADARTEAEQRLGLERKQLDEAEALLQDQIKRLTGGLAPGIQLPKIKL